MTQDSNKQRADLKYSNYFAEPASASTAKQASPTRSLETATWILFALCFIPFIGAVFATATVVLGIVLITRDRLIPGLIAVIVAPLACAAVTFFVFIFFIATVGTAAAHQVEQELKTRSTMPTRTR
jgi:hypothetical protein